MTSPVAETKERIHSHPESVDAYDRFKDHLAANGIDLGKTPATLGPMLTLDSDTERFVGEFSEKGNQLVSSPYRKPFVVPSSV